MANKYLQDDKSTLLKNKLERLSKVLDRSVNSGELQTQEQVIAEAITVLESFYKSLKDPRFDPAKINVDDLPDKNIYNKLWDDLLDDLSIVFAELENVEDITVANFNFVATESNRLTARLKRVSSMLGDYILYNTNPTRDALFFKDSFNDLSRIDFNSPLINTAQCEIGQDEGIVTLPINKDKESRIQIKASPIINPDSNGQVGNNQEIGARFNGDVDVLLDNNPDTWFEYERVTTQSEDSKEALVLDITINLGTETVANYIRINPNNFGTKTTIIIDRIETSLDGKVYTNIKDDIPIAGFITEDEQNIFTLAPSTSKFAGQGIYSFIPRKIKYIHFVFKQTEPYLIDTPQGSKLRYAIGIRDVDIRGYQYHTTGEFISKPFLLTDEIRKVLLDANQNPTEESELATIDYFISPDDGQTWNQIQPKSFNGRSAEAIEVPEILNFNGPEDDALETAIPVKSIRLKAILERKDTAFEDGSSTLRKEVKSRSEIHDVPNTSPFEFELEQPPVEGSLQVIDPMFGSRGVREVQYIVGHASPNGPAYNKFYLPFQNLPRPYKKAFLGGAWRTLPKPASEWLHVTIGNEDWTHATQPLSLYTAAYSTDTEFRLFTFNPATGILSFGTGGDTMPPPAGSPVGVYFDAEQLFPSEVPGSHLARLDFKTGNDKTAVAIKRYSASEETTEVVPRRSTVLRLEHENITSVAKIATVIGSLDDMDASPTTFINGSDELLTSGDWSIDTEHGVIYLSTPTPADRDVSLTYSYEEITELTQDDWDWGNKNELRDSVIIKDSAWQTILKEDLSLPTTSGSRVLDLANLGVVNGTLEITLLDDAEEELDANVDPFLKEVPFIDGITELGGQVIKTIERIPSLTPGGSNIATYDLKQNISGSTDFVVSFNNATLFLAEDPALNTVGDWTIDRTVGSPTYGRLSVKMPSSTAVSEPGKITYFYTNPKFADNGLYSVDYKLGRIYLQRSLVSTWSLMASYQYTDYRVEYKIARILDPNYYNVDVTTRTVTIKDEEILKHNVIPREKLPNQTLYYQVNYDYVSETREDILALRDFFSPVIKDYVLKVITKGRLQ